MDRREMTAACVCGWPETECLRRVLGNGPPFPPEPCEPKLGADPVKETASSAARGSDTPTGVGPEVSAATPSRRRYLSAGECESCERELKRGVRSYRTRKGYIKRLCLVCRRKDFRDE